MRYASYFFGLLRARLSRNRDAENTTVLNTSKNSLSSLLAKLHTCKCTETVVFLRWICSWGLQNIYKLLIAEDCNLLLVEEETFWQLLMNGAAELVKIARRWGQHETSVEDVLGLYPLELRYYTKRLGLDDWRWVPSGTGRVAVHN